MSQFDVAFNITVGHEGDYSNDPKDAGGATRFGITERVARAHGYLGEMRLLPFNFAKDIYHEQYWKLLRLDDIEGVSVALALELFDTAVNCSQGFAARSLQESLNVLNRGARDYSDMEVDGLLGAVTLADLRVYFGRRGKEGETVLLRMLNCLQGAYYVHISEQRVQNEDFVFGWFKNRVSIT